MKLICGIFVVLYFLIAVPVTFLFLLISQDYEYDKTFYFVHDGENYEVRRHVFGGATLSDTRYSFDTYRLLAYLPIEKRITQLDFFDDKTNLMIDGQLTFNFIDSNGRHFLSVTDIKGTRSLNAIK